MTEDQLESITNCGAAEMPLEETCLITQCTLEEFLADETALACFRRGQLKSKLKIRQAIVRMAGEGIPQMVKIYQDMTKITLPKYDDVELGIQPEMENTEAMTVEELVDYLKANGGEAATVADIQKMLDAGAPVRPDGKINLADFMAYLETLNNE